MASTSTSDGASEVLGFKPTALIDEVFNIVRFSARAPSRLAKPWCPLVLSAPEAVILTVAAGANCSAGIQQSTDALEEALRQHPVLGQQPKVIREVRGRRRPT